MSVSSRTSRARAEFLAWARHSLQPLSRLSRPEPEQLAALGEMIGDASIVALGEGDHFGAEPLLFRNRLFEYLVREKGFTAIALESGVVEARVVEEYIAGGDGTLKDVIARGISWTFDQAPQNATLIRWLRAHNAACEATCRVRFYGFDVPGSPGNPHANRSLDTALLEILRFLDRVDEGAAKRFRARLIPFMARLRFDRYEPESIGYHKLHASERDALSANILDLQSLLEMREARYAEIAGAEDYEWALRAAVGARQVDGWLRHIPLGWRGSDEDLRFLDSAGEWRDRAQAANVEWIVRREEPRGKVLVFGHNGHLSTAPVRWSWFVTGARSQDEDCTPAVCRHEVAGGYLKRRFGDRLCTIGNLIARGALGAAQYSRALPTASPDSIDGLTQEVGVPHFVLDLRRAPPAVAQWLNRERILGRGFELADRCRIEFRVSAVDAFDVLLYTDEVTPARDHAEN